LIAAAVLRRAGFPVDLFDATFADGPERFAEALGRSAPDIFGLVEDGFSVLVKMCTGRQREDALRMVGQASAAGCRVLASAPDAANRPEAYVVAGADAVLLGETEETLVELVGVWSADPAAVTLDIPGLAVPGTGGGVIRTPQRPFIEDLDALPLPAWDLVDVETYRRAWTSTHGRLSWNIVTTRGCPFRCGWCSKPVYGTRYAQRSPAGVAEELALLCDRVGPGHVWFADDIFGLTPRWIESFAEEVLRRDARIPFSVQSRVDLMHPSAVEALHVAGCEEVWLGVESGAQLVLDGMEKGTRVEQIRSATRLLAARGIRPSWFLMLGFPGEDWDEIVATRELIREERPADVGVSVAYPLPGSRFFEDVKDDLGPVTSWQESDDLATTFSATFSTGFYRQVRDLLHEEARAARVDGGRRLFNAHRHRLDALWRDLETRRDESRSPCPTPAGVRRAGA
jgi:anaerobic magnesium-protoporphyrin IX monomethyl ester cyclase